MDLNKLYKKQAELDKHILEKHNIKMSKEELLDNTVLALLVEVSELANTTRCFKHWSTKGMMDKENILDEYADCLHFYFSIGNQMGIKYSGKRLDYGMIFNNIEQAITFQLLILYANLGALANECSVNGVVLDDVYEDIGDGLIKIAELLDFTDDEVEQAYLKKHEENYKRQREGY